MSDFQTKRDAAAEAYCDQPRCAPMNRSDKTWHRAKAAWLNGYDKARAEMQAEIDQHVNEVRRQIGLKTIEMMRVTAWRTQALNLKTALEKCVKENSEAWCAVNRTRGSCSAEVRDTGVEELAEFAAFAKGQVE